MIKCLGIVNFEDTHSVVEGLSKYRSIAAMNFLGRYRVVDITLSNMVNSGMDHIDILCRERPRALMEHISGGEQYNINPKSGSLRIIYSDYDRKAKSLFTDINLIQETAADIDDTPYDLVCVAACNNICRINYQDVLKAHVESGADITVVYKNVPAGADEYLNCRALKMDGNKVLSGDWNLSSKEAKAISMETYIMNKEVLLEIARNATSESGLYDLKSYLRENARFYDVQGYEFKGYLKCINSLDSYYVANTDLLTPASAKSLFSSDWPLYTKTSDTAPTYYGRKSKVKNSIVANGCRIHGEVENCILGRGVYVARGAKVKNSIILPGVVIGANAHVEYAILDRESQVIIIKEIVGTRDELAYLDRRERV